LNLPNYIIACDFIKSCELALLSESVRMLEFVYSDLGAVRHLLTCCGICTRPNIAFKHSSLQTCW